MKTRILAAIILVAFSGCGDTRSPEQKHMDEWNDALTDLPDGWHCKPTYRGGPTGDSRNGQAAEGICTFEDDGLKCIARVRTPYASLTVIQDHDNGLSCVSSNTGEAAHDQ